MLHTILFSVGIFHLIVATVGCWVFPQDKAQVVNPMTFCAIGIILASAVAKYFWF